MSLKDVREQYILALAKKRAEQSLSTFDRGVAKTRAVFAKHLPFTAPPKKP